MPYPDDFSTACYDATQGRDDEDGDYVPEDCFAAAADLLHAIDRGWNPESWITALRVAVAAERESRAEDEARRRSLYTRIAVKQGNA
jgi:hypothetical protein